MDLGMYFEKIKKSLIKIQNKNYGMENTIML
jgi:hypothetical protein